MEEGNYLAVWLFDKAARAFLGLPAASTESRWCALGVMLGESQVGIWLEIDALHERHGPDNKVVQSWEVKPKTCLIRWDFVVHVQVFGKVGPGKKEFGFVQTGSS